MTAYRIRTNRTYRDEHNVVHRIETHAPVIRSMHWPAVACTEKRVPYRFTVGSQALTCLFCLVSEANTPAA